METSYFTWNVSREIIHFVGPFGLRWYSLFFLSGILMGYSFLGKFLEQEGRNVEIRDTLLYYIVVATIVGARLGHCFLYNPSKYLSDPLSIIRVWEGGLASHGGYTGVLLSIFLFTRKYRSMSFFWVADRLAIFGLLTGSCIRIGNFFNSEIIGLPSTVPWAVVFAKVDSIPRHPTQLYESFGYGLISLILYRIYRYYNRNPLGGRILGFALLLGYLFRFFIEFFKENQAAFEDSMIMNMGQAVSLPFVFIGLYLVIGWQKNNPWLRWAYFEEAETNSDQTSVTEKNATDRKKERFRTDGSKV